MKNIKSKMALLGLVGTLAMGSTGCSISSINNKENNDNKITENTEELPYIVYGTSYYYDENDVLHQITKASLIETTTELVVDYIPEGYVLKNTPEGEKVFSEQEIVKIVDGEKKTETILKEDGFDISFHQIFIYDDPSFTHDKIEEYVKSTASNHGFDPPTKIYVKVFEYFLPENAYVLEEDINQGIPNWCYIDTIVTDELTQNEVAQELTKKL